jgi:hypothetical protein
MQGAGQIAKAAAAMATQARRFLWSLNRVTSVASPGRSALAPRDGSSSRSAARTSSRACPANGTSLLLLLRSGGFRRNSLRHHLGAWGVWARIPPMCEVGARLL